MLGERLEIPKSALILGTHHADGSCGVSTSRLVTVPHSGVHLIVVYLSVDIDNTTNVDNTMRFEYRYLLYNSKKLKLFCLSME